MLLSHLFADHHHHHHHTRRYLWPVGSARLPALARFRSSDHLKGNGALGVGVDGGSSGRANDCDAAVGSGGRAEGVRASRGGEALSLSYHADQVRDIVEEATGVSKYGVILGGGGYVW